MKNVVFAFLIALLVVSPILAQDIVEVEPYYTPQALSSHTTTRPDTFEYLVSSLGDSIWVREHRNDAYFIYPDGAQYKAINLDFYSDVDSIFPFDFSGDGKPEYVLFTYSSSGRSGWQSGWNDQESSIYVLDADKAALLLRVDLYRTYNFWSNELEYGEDSTEGPEITSSSGIYECESKIVFIDQEQRSIYVDPNDTSYCEEYEKDPMYDENWDKEGSIEEDRSNVVPFNLRLTAAGFIREEIDGYHR
jgi:hypothetical protein